MNKLIKGVRELQKSAVSKLVKQRLGEFSSFKSKPDKEWFSELCFCILTANSRARTAMQIQQQLGANGFCEGCAADLRKCIHSNKHRFHNNKTKFIIAAREHKGIKSIIQKLVSDGGEKAAREWLVQNVKGLGWKESSHFLRNVGYTNLAILDRHILNLLLEHGFIDERPKTLGKIKYLEIEQNFLGIVEQLGMSAAELDLYMWYMKTGEVLK